MSKKEKQNETPQQEPAVEEQDVKQEAAAEPEETAVDPLLSELESLKDQVAGQEDKYLRLAAEYDNYRKRTAKEKESLWTDVKADTAGAFLPVYDNLERALKQDTADEAFKKGVEMTMNQLKEVLTKLGITEIPAQASPSTPSTQRGDACGGREPGPERGGEVFQTGFQCGEKVIRFAMVKVAN